MDKLIDEGNIGNRYEFIKNSWLQHQVPINNGDSPDRNYPLDAAESHNGVAPNGKKAVVDVLPLEAP